MAKRKETKKKKPSRLKKTTPRTAKKKMIIDVDAVLLKINPKLAKQVDKLLKHIEKNPPRLHDLKSVAATVLKRAQGVSATLKNKVKK